MKFVNPSREDAYELTRKEKASMQYIAHAASALEEAKDDLGERLGHVDNGAERMAKLSADAIQLLTELRMTVPERQRMSMINTAKDMEIRLVPKFTPTSHNVVVQKEDFRELVNCAQAKCRECAYDDEECKACRLYQLLSVILPMDDYHWHHLCPYVAEWEN